MALAPSAGQHFIKYQASQRPTATGWVRSSPNPQFAVVPRCAQKMQSRGKAVGSSVRAATDAGVRAPDY